MMALRLLSLQGVMIPGGKVSPKCRTPQSRLDHLGNKRAFEPNARLEKACRSCPSFMGGGEKTVRGAEHV